MTHVTEVARDGGSLKTTLRTMKSLGELLAATKKHDKIQFIDRHFGEAGFITDLENTLNNNILS